MSTPHQKRKVTFFFFSARWPFNIAHISPVLSVSVPPTHKRKTTKGEGECDMVIYLIIYHFLRYKNPLFRRLCLFNCIVLGQFGGESHSLFRAASSCGWVRQLSVSRCHDIHNSLPAMQIGRRVRRSAFFRKKKKIFLLAIVVAIGSLDSKWNAIPFSLQVRLTNELLFSCSAMMINFVSSTILLLLRWLIH